MNTGSYALETDGVSTREGPKAGRRRAPAAYNRDDDGGGPDPDAPANGASRSGWGVSATEDASTGRRSEPQSDVPSPPPRGRAGSWDTGDDGGSAAAAPASEGVAPVMARGAAAAVDSSGGEPKFKGVSRRKAQQEEEGRDGGGHNRRKHLDDDSREQDIMEIPELGEEAADGISAGAMAAPARYRAHRVQSIRELEQSGGNLAANGSAAADLDLSLLTALLCPPEQLDEGDAPWEPEALLQQLGSDLTAEEEAKEAGEEGGAKSEAAAAGG